jgi:hypothetical protein
MKRGSVVAARPTTGLVKMKSRPYYTVLAFSAIKSHLNQVISINLIPSMDLRSAAHAVDWLYYF